MQTNFSLARLADPDIATAESILRKCVHCGFCLATCPTYTLLGDERDSPRGRIYLIKDMLENDRPADATVARHVDRCLSCLSCMTTCPSGVDYMHLVDHARAHIEKTHRRPMFERLLRRGLTVLLPRPGLFRLAMVAARPVAFMAWLFPGRLRSMLRFARARIHAPSWANRPQVVKAQGPRRKRVALLTGCVQQVLAPEINEATIRLLARHGCEVVVVKGAGCCGALSHHLGETSEAEGWARRNIDAFCAELDGDGLDAIIANASGCGTMLKDYGFLFRNDPAMAERAARVAGLARDVSELIADLGLKEARNLPSLTIAYHSACSLQHGQKVHDEPKRLLEAAGFTVRDVPNGHLCCGSAGSYNLLQPAIADQLGRQKAASIESVAPDIVATGNIGCMVQIARSTRLPLVHTAELLDWATGGNKPHALIGLKL